MLAQEGRGQSVGRLWPTAVGAALARVRAETGVGRVQKLREPRDGHDMVCATLLVEISSSHGRSGRDDADGLLRVDYLAHNCYPHISLTTIECPARNRRGWIQ